VAAIGVFTVLAILNSGIWSRASSDIYVGGDADIAAWVLTQVSDNLIERPFELFEGNLFYPEPRSVLFANPLIGLSVLLLPFRPFTANPALLLNLATLLSLVVSSYGFFLLARWLWGDPAAALLAGIAIPHSANQLHHLLHPNLLAICGFPFLLLALFRLHESPAVRWAVLAAVALAFQVLDGGFGGLSAVTLSLVFAAWGFRRFLTTRSGLYAVLAAVIAMPLVLPYVLAFGELELLPRALEESRYYSLHLPADLFRTGAWVWRDILPAPGDSAFPGLIALALAVFAMLRSRDPRVGLLLVTAGVFFVLALGPELTVGGLVVPMPYAWLFEYLPLLRAGRHPVSFIAVTVMAVGLLGALGMHQTGLSRRRWLVALVLLGAAVETLIPPPPRRSRGPMPEVYAELLRLPSGPMLELPFDVDKQQYWAAVHKRPTVNGISPHKPQRFMALKHHIRSEWAGQPAQSLEGSRALRFLKAHFPVRYLVVHAGTRLEIQRNVEATPTSFVLLHTTQGGDRIYRVLRHGRHPWLRRGFPAKDVASRRLRARLKGPAAELLVVQLGKSELARVRLTGKTQELILELPELRTRDLVLIDLFLEPEAAGDIELELLEPIPDTLPEAHEGDAE
jgi:hypothetical protein